MKRTLLTDGIRPFPGKKTMLYEVENDVFLAIQIGKMGSNALHKKSQLLQTMRQKALLLMLRNKVISWGTCLLCR